MKKLLLSAFLAVSLAFAPLCGLLPTQYASTAQAAKVLYSTNAQSTLNGTINNSTTTVVVTSAASFPSISGGSGDWFVIRMDSELMKVTATSGTTFTVVRAFEGTSAASHTSGVTITGVLTAAMLDQLKLDANISGISGNSGQSTLGSPFTLNAATTVYQDTGLSVALPAAGTYDICATALSQVKISSGAIFTVAKLYNSTDSTDIGTIKFIGYQEVLNITTYLSTSWCVVNYTIAAAKTVKLYVYRNFTGTVTTSTVEGGTSQDTSITWKRVN